MEERPLADDIHPDLTPEGRRRAARAARFDQHIGPQGQFWASRFWRVLARVSLGTWQFSAGWNKVTLSRSGTAGKVVIADAIRVR